MLDSYLHPAFNNKTGNLKATIERGWYFLNKILLLHPSIQKTKALDAAPSDQSLPETSLSVTSSQKTSSLQPDPESFNKGEGLHTACLDKLLEFRKRSEGYEQSVQKKRRTKEGITKTIAETKRFSTGVLASQGIHCLNDPRFLSGMEQRQKLNEELERKSAAKKMADLKKYWQGVVAIRAKFGADSTHNFQKCSANECRDYLQYKKIAGDKAMPSNLSERRALCVKRIGRASPSHSFDEVNASTDGRGEADTSTLANAPALLELGNADDEMEVEETVVRPAEV